MTSRETTPSVKTKAGAVLLAVLLPMVWLAVVRIVSHDPGREREVDAFYHAGMADGFPQSCVVRSFPWTTLSVWNSTFYDKELLYHGALAVVRGAGRVFGFGLEPPFHFPALVFAALLIGVFAAAAAQWGVPHVWLWTLVLASFCPFFSERLLMLRPHVPAIAITLLFVQRLATWNPSRKLWEPLLFGMAMAYTYSNPHFLLLPASAFAALKYREDRRLAVAVPLSALAGIVAGLALHPQFPNTFLLWKIQCLDVVRQMLQGRAPVYLGVELYRPDPPWLMRNALAFAAAAFGVLGALRLCRQTPPARWPMETRLVGLLAAATFAGVFLSKRALEYAWPFLLLAAALIGRDLLRNPAGRPAELLRRLPAVIAVCVLAVSAAFGWRDVEVFRKAQWREFRSFSEWASGRLADGTAIANPNWSDFPMLFYSAPQFRYSMGLDPMFAHHADPDRMEKLEAFRTGQTMIRPSELKSLVNARFAFVSIYAWELARDMCRSGYVFIYQGDDGWLFDLDQPAAK